MSKPNHTPIAVVGVGAIFPGTINKEGFWKDILSGVDRMSEVPPTHWLAEDYYDPDPAAPDKVYATRGGFLPDVDFDPVEWGVPPSIVPATDTCQLLALIVARQVLDDVGKAFNDNSKEKTSVILGVTSSQELLGSMVSRLQRPVWVKGLREAGIPEDEVIAICDRISANYTDWQENTFPGVLGNVVAGRIANRLGLGGTNCVTDAACASSLAALAMGVQELRLGDSDLVVTGGADTMNDIFMYECFSKTTALSPTGDCRPFSDQADGTMLGEGIGMIALKRLADAERDGDPIYAVIKGVGASSDGRAKSVYAPVPAGQAKALRRAYEQAGFGPETVGLVEAHGTGTKAGDKAEFEALKTVFDESGRPDRGWCAIGSIKSQIGHTKASAGAAGLIKAVLALHHRVLPPTTKIERPNPGLNLDETPFHLSLRARPWASDGTHPRRASVSSFGFGGSNFHVALEEYTATEKTSASRRGRFRAMESELVILTGANAANVSSRCDELLGDLQPGDLPRVALKTQTAYDAKANARLAIVATDEEDLRAKLERARERLKSGNAFSDPSGMYFGVGEHEGKIAFLFPGQGSQYLDMGGNLSIAFDSARRAWDLAASLPLADDGNLPTVVFPKSAFSDEDKDAQRSRLIATEWAQPAIGTVSLSMLVLLEQIGIKADALGGHSFGELTALCAAGAISADDLLRAARSRGEAMRDASSTPGAMIAVRADIDTIMKAGVDKIDGVVIANHNAPTQVVLSGTVDGIDQAEATLKGAKIRFARLPVSTAFHSQLVASAVKPFRATLEEITIDAPSTPVFANKDGKPFSSDAKTIRDQVAQQIAAPVQFVDQVRAMASDGVRTFIEVGPSSVLTDLVGAILDGQPHRIIPLDRKGQEGVTAWHRALGQLAAAGVDMQPAALWEEFEAPAERAAQRKLTLKINGANYGKPYPPPGGAAALPKPNPKREAPSATVTAAPLPNQATPQLQATSPAVTTPSNPTPAGSGSMTQPPAVAPAIDAGWLSAWQDVHAQTAHAHAAYQQAMADAHTAYLASAEASIRAISGVVGGSVAAGAPVAQPTYAAPPMAAPYSPPAAPMAPPVAQAPVAPPMPVAVTPAAAAPAMAAASAAVAVKTPTAPVGVDMQAALIDAVADKTGYPAEMLQGSMDLESDLGVDSIKRVEILAALKEKVPTLPDLDPAEVGALRTLDDIVDFVKARMPELAGAIASAASGVYAAATTPHAASAPVAVGVDMQAALIDAVADKTGYPAEMLQGTMDLESDLGVDSIKRVEILAALKEKVPNLPDLDPAEVGALRTLDDIVDFVKARMPELAGAIASAASGVYAAATTPHAASAPVAVGVDMQAALIDAVADKTGYPAEMLQGTMDLESDLGVDSIKRVEILAALKEKVPNLPDLDPAEVGALRTLDDIVQFVRARMPELANVGVASNGSANGAATGANGATTAGIDLRVALIDAVADKTGYPAEMLQGTMDLESDLGVDSIKRVEILAALKEKVPNLPDLDPAEVGALRTLDDIVRFIEQKFGGGHDDDPTGGGATAVASVMDDAEVGPQVSRFEVSAVPAPNAGLAIPRLLTAKHAVITQDPHGIAIELSRVLGGHGIDAKVVTEVPSDADAVICLDGLAIGDDPEHGIDACRFVFGVAKAIAERFTADGGLFVTVQDTGGDFGLSGSSRAWYGGISGMTKTTAREWPKASVRAIDVDIAGREPAVVARAIADELLFGGGELEVGLRADGERLTLISRESDVVAAEVNLGESDVVLASGGARGVTATSLIRLVEKTRCKVVLLGRTPLADEPAGCDNAKTIADLQRVLIGLGGSKNPADIRRQASQILAGREVRETIAAIQAKGGDARYVAADVRDAASLEDALKPIRAEWGPVTVLVHGAGVLADKKIVDKTQEQFDFVFDTKVLGLRALLDVTRGDPLKAIVLFSSVAGRCGNPGQCDYAMANEVLNKVASAEYALREGKTVVRSINWGPWDGGMVSDGLRAHFASLGVPLIPLGRGADAFVDECLSTPQGSTEVVIGGDPRRFSGGQESVRHFDILVERDTHPYLDGHRVKGDVVVPVVLVAEWFARAARACHPDLTFAGYTDLQVLNGIQLEDFAGGSQRFAVEVKVPNDPKTHWLDVSIVDPQGRPRYRARAHVRNGEAVELPDPPQSIGELTPLTVPVYGDVLFHGAQFQVIRDLDGVSDRGATASMVGANSVGWPTDGWQTDAALLDGGLQLALLWTRHALGGHSLPTRIESLRLFQPGLLSGKARAHLVGREAKGDRAISDVLFVDDAGAPVAEFRGVETFILPGSRSSK